jgi:hypothetical protein
MRPTALPARLPLLALALAVGLTACSGTGAPGEARTVPDEELAPVEAFDRSVRVGTTSFLYRQRAEDPSLFDVRVSGVRRVEPGSFLDAVGTVYGCTSMRLVGLNRLGTAALVKGNACKRSQYFAE